MSGVLAIIPARGGSKGVPRKNLRALGGMSLTARAIECARLAGIFDRIVVSSDDQEILAQAKSHGAEALVRPEALASDDAIVSDTVAYCLDLLERQGFVPMTIVLLEPSCPLRTPEIIHRALKLMEGCDSVMSVSPVDVKFHAARQYLLDPDGRAVSAAPLQSPVVRRQSLRQSFIKNGAVYAFRRDIFQRERTIPCGIVKAFSWDQPLINIDTLQDLQEAEKIWESRKVGAHNVVLPAPDAGPGIAATPEEYSANRAPRERHPTNESWTDSKEHTAMTFNPLIGKVVACLVDSVPQGARVVELGNQTFTMHDPVLDWVIQYRTSRGAAQNSLKCLQALRNTTMEARAPLTEQYYKALGFSSYNAIDVNSKYGSLIMDLNYNLRERYGYTQTFDFVTNNGTGEHIFNQYAVFKNMHELCNVGGIMLHCVPFVNWVNHGFFNFHAILFADLAAANGYEIVRLGLADRDGREVVFQKGGVQQDAITNSISLDDLLKHIGPNKGQLPLAQAIRSLSPGGSEAPNVLVVAALRKTKEQPFAVPIQGKYLQDIEDKSLQHSYAAQVPQQPSVPTRIVQMESVQFPEPQMAASARISVCDRSRFSPLSILSRAWTTQIRLDPIPHVLIHDALDPALYKQLAAEYPSQSIISGGKTLGSNEPCFLLSSQCMNHPHVSPLWKDFMRYHTSATFFQEIAAIFGDHIRRVHPRIEALVGKKLEDFSTEMRGAKDPNADFSMDCQYVINAPVTKPSSVRGPHLDCLAQLYSSLLYFRLPEDNTDGGNFEIRRVVDPNYVFYGKAEMDARFTEVVSVVPYSPNTLIFLINCYEALHGVSPRPVTPFMRRLLSTSGEMTPRHGNLFEIPPERRTREIPACARDIVSGAMAPVAN